MATAGVLLAAIAIDACLRCVWFYRDPPRNPPQEQGLVLAPCDGRVVHVRRVEGGIVEAEKLGERIPLSEIVERSRDGGGDVDGWLVGIYISPLDVHFTYAPIEGRVRRIVYTPARVNYPMVDLWEYVQLSYLRRAVNLFGRRHHLHNERNAVWVEGDGLDLIMVEIADRFVNKITCFARQGMHLARGQKVSFIARGSQVDLVLLRPDVEVVVTPGTRVRGATSIVARYAPAGAEAAGGCGRRGATPDT